jgi:hypothetical protein
MGNEVQILPWFRVIHHANKKRIVDIFNFLRIETVDIMPVEGVWKVCAITLDKKEVVSNCYLTPNTAAEFIDWFYEMCTADGLKIHLTAEMPKRKSQSHDSLYISVAPVIGKQEVLFATQHGILFPPQVNRHTIKNRLINIAFPLETLSQGKPIYKAKLEEHLTKSRYVINKKPIWFDERYYEEPTIQIIHK